MELPVLYTTSTGRRIAPSLGSKELGVGMTPRNIGSNWVRTERAASCDPDKPQKSHDTTHVKAISPLFDKIGLHMNDYTLRNE